MTRTQGQGAAVRVRTDFTPNALVRREQALFTQHILLLLRRFKVVSIINTVAWPAARVGSLSSAVSAAHIVVALVVQRPVRGLSFFGVQTLVVSHALSNTRVQHLHEPRRAHVSIYCCFHRLTGHTLHQTIAREGSAISSASALLIPRWSLRTSKAACRQLAGCAAARLSRFRV